MTIMRLSTAISGDTMQPRHAATALTLAAAVALEARGLLDHEEEDARGGEDACFMPKPCLSLPP